MTGDMLSYGSKMILMVQFGISFDYKNRRIFDNDGNK